SKGSSLTNERQTNAWIDPPGTRCSPVVRLCRLRSVVERGGAHSHRRGTFAILHGRHAAADPCGEPGSIPERWRLTTRGIPCRGVSGGRRADRPCASLLCAVRSSVECLGRHGLCIVGRKRSR